MSQRIALGVAYAGTGFKGWQRQANERTVQGELESALARIADHSITVRAAGRTDSGVHASGQVVHFDTVADRTDKAWVEGVNRWLPDDVAVRWVAHPGEDFDARFSALSRQYRYLFFYDQMANPFLERFAVREHRALDVRAMHEAAQHLIGEHDFTSFRAAQCQSNSPVRELRSIQVMESAGFVIVTVTANAFLYHMVRNIVGALRSVGFGQVDPGWIRALLEAKNRHLAGRMAPAHGLYLEHVEYASRFGLPDRADFLVPGGK